ncbi:MAG TPA: hypothetical protein VEA99_20325 [Gemmatimonadaceae bacterium]|nr:hypothetical protein [Gemmatimonadaceae bacterium]
MRALALASLALVVASAAAAQSSYTGRWRLDVAQSRDLPPYYSTITEHRLDIAHSDSLLTVDVALVDTAAATHRLRFPYDLRKPVATTTQVLGPRGPIDVPTTLTATPRADGGLEIEIAREIRMGERVLRPGDHESWRLSADGTQLLIDRVAEMPGPGGLRTVRSHYVFVRG